MFQWCYHENTATGSRNPGKVISRRREIARRRFKEITKREFERLRDSVQVNEQENGLVEVRTLMNMKQLDLIETLLFEDDSKNLDDIQSKLYEFGSTVHSTDYIGRRIFVCLFHMVQGMKYQQLSEAAHQ